MMYARLSLIAVLILAAAGGALFFAGGAPAQSRDAGPALQPGERAININASAFLPKNPNLGITPAIENTSADRYYYAALQLPQGSTIKRIVFWGKDNDNSAYMRLILYAQVNNFNAYNTVRLVATSLTGASDTYQYWYSPLFTHTMKWNRAYFFELLVRGASASPPNYQEFRYVRVIYEPAP